MIERKEEREERFRERKSSGIDRKKRKPTKNHTKIRRRKSRKRQKKGQDHFSLSLAKIRDKRGKKIGMKKRDFQRWTK